MKWRNAVTVRRKHSRGTPTGAAVPVGSRLALGLEVFKCAALAAIVVLLALLLRNTPAPFTLGSLAEHRGDALNIPIVHVEGGSVDVSGSVDVGNTVDVSGTVSVEP